MGWKAWPGPLAKRGPAVDDNPVAGCDTLEDDAQTADQRAELDLLGDNLATLADHQQDLARLVGLHRRVRDEQRIDFRTGLQAHVSEHSRRKKLLRIVDDGTRPNGTRPRIQRIVGEIELAMPAIFRFILQPDIDRSAVEPLAFGFQEKRFRSVEGEVDGIQRIDRRQQRGAVAIASADKIAGVNAAVRYAARDRRPNRAELDVQAATAHLRLGRGQRGFAGPHLRHQPVYFRFRDRIVRNQPLRTGQIAARKIERGAGRCNARLRFRQRGAIGAGVESEQRGTLTNKLTVGKMDRCYLTRYTGAHIHRPAGFEPADKFVPLGDLALQRGRNADDR